MPTLNEEKYENAILYFAQHVRNVGRTKLWKLLYYLDFDHYELFGTSVTGDDYLRWDNGPVPAQGLAVVRRMEAAGDIRIVPEPTGLQHPMLKVESYRHYDKDVFSPSEWEVLQAVGRKWKFHSARDMSNATHGEQPWLQADWNGFLDYDLASNRGSEDDDNDEALDQPGVEDSDMKVTREFALARARSLAYAERIERLWDTDPAVRARIERGIAQMNAGEFVPVNIDALIEQRRDKGRPS